MKLKPILLIVAGASLALGLAMWLHGWPGAARSPATPTAPVPADSAASADAASSTGAASSVGAAAPAAEVAAVTAHLKALFDGPEAPLQVNPVVVEGSRAVAGWVQGNMGGRALLQKRQGAWEVVICAGDSLRDPTTYALNGMDEAAAGRLAAKVRTAEASLPAETLHRFSLFSGSVRGQDHTGHKHTQQPSPQHDAPAEGHSAGHHPPH